MTKFGRIKNFVKQIPDHCFLGESVTEETVCEIESQLGIRFPEEYRIFLKEWGGLTIAGSYYNYDGVRLFKGALKFIVLEHTQSCREQGLPSTYFAFSSDEGDEYLCMDTSPASDSQVEIFEYFEGTFRAVWSSGFFDAIEKDINENVIPYLKSKGIDVEY